MANGNLDIQYQKMEPMTKEVLAIIPARGGSKGLPRKNVLDLAGKPLMAWTIEASLNSKYITETIVSSEDDEILRIAKQYSAKTIKRPSNLAKDSSSSEEVVKHVLESLDKEFDYIVLLQPTSPLRTSKDIDDAFELLIKNKASSLISVYEIDNKYLKAFIEDKDGYIEGINNNSYPFIRRQDLPDIYMSNGAIYIIEKKFFIEKNSFYTEKTVPFFMEKSRSVDVDSLVDLNNIENFIKLKKLKK